MSAPSSSVAARKGSQSNASNDSNSIPTTNIDRTSRLAPRNNYPSIPWIRECWQQNDNRYERIATGSPLTSIALLSQGLVQHHINLLPTLDSVSDFLAMYNDKGLHMGSRPKLATWPLTEREARKNKVWSA